MATKIDSSENYSKLGVITYVQTREYNVDSRKNLKIFKLKKGWGYKYQPSDLYIIAKRNYDNPKSVGKYLDETMLVRIYRKKKQQEEFENRCAVLAARMFKFS